jgi:hypothetical protein
MASQTGMARHKQMDKKKATNLAARMLANKKFPDEVMAEISRKGNMSWEEAEEIVEDTIVNRQGLIATYRAPGKLIASIVMLAIGAFLLSVEWIEETFDITVPLYNGMVNFVLPIPGVAYVTGEQILFYTAWLLVGLGGLTFLSVVMSVLIPGKGKSLHGKPMKTVDDADDEDGEKTRGRRKKKKKK